MNVFWQTRCSLSQTSPCEEGRGHCGDQRMLGGDIHTKCMMGGGTMHEDPTMTKQGR